MNNLGESNLRSFTLDTKPEDSVYNFEGEDFRYILKSINRRFDLRYNSSKVEFFLSFFGRIEDTKNKFRN